MLAFRCAGVIEERGLRYENVWSLRWFAVGDGAFGICLHADGNRSGFLAVADLPVPGQSLNAIFRMPVGPGDKALESLIAQGTGLQQQRNAANQAVFSKEGAKLHFALNRGELNGESAAFNEGKAGIGVVNNGVIQPSEPDHDSDCVLNIATAKVGSVLASQVHFHAP